MRRLLLTLALAGWGTEALAAKPIPPRDGYVSVTARVENAHAFKPGVAIKREAAVVVCMGEPGQPKAECAPVWWETREGTTSGRQQADRVLLSNSPTRGLGPYVSVVGIRVWRNDIVRALARAAVAVPVAGGPNRVALDRAQKSLDSITEGRRKRTRTVQRPTAPTELSFVLDPKNRALPQALTVDCKATPAAEACGQPRVIVSFEYVDWVGRESAWVDPILESCTLPKGTTTSSLHERIDAAAGRLSDAQLRAERRMLALAQAVLEARAAARDPDRAAERLWAYLSDAHAGDPGALWEAHYRERASSLQACVADLELFEPVHALVGVLAEDATAGPDDAQLHALARLMAQMEGASATFNDVFRDANLRRGQLEIEPMQRLERLMKNAAEAEVTTLVAESPCARCRTLGEQWLAGRKRETVTRKDQEVRATLLDTDRALQDMEHALTARQAQLAKACRNYDAGHAGRLLADVREAKDGVAALIVHTTFDDAARDKLTTLRTDLLRKLPDVVSALAQPVERACGKKSGGAASPTTD